MSAPRRPPARGKGRRAPRGGDVSIWQGMVVRSEDFAPVPRRRGKKPWLVLAGVGAIGAGIAAYAVITSSEPEPSGNAAAKPAAAAASPAVAASQKQLEKPGAAAATAPVDLAADAVSAAAPIFKKQVTKKATPTKRAVKKRVATKKKSSRRRHR